MEGRKLIQSILLDNLLSYGPQSSPLSLEPLNVLIGPNASGKSNLIEALSLLAAAPKDLQVPIREGGGVGDWLWKGSTGATTATLDVDGQHVTKETVGDGPVDAMFKAIRSIAPRTRVASRDSQNRRKPRWRKAPQWSLGGSASAAGMVS